jgi:predicted phosphodiesterase
MIYVTGDTHGELDRFKSKAAKGIRKGDSLIVCGDFGFVWNGSHEEEKRLRWLSKRRYRILFVEGTHDNLDLLARYPEEDFCGGRARHIAGGVYQLLRGQVYEIEGKKIFAFGGGESEDQDVRAEGISWWRQELPAQEELEVARDNLARHKNAVDFIVTHQCSAAILSLLQLDGPAARVNVLGAFFDWVSRNVRYRAWYFGSLHLDKAIPPNAVGLFEKILPVQL